MNRRVERVRSGVRAVIREIRREDVTFMAASIAYHAFVSMLPVLLLVMLLVSLFEGEQFDAAVIGMTRAVLPTSGRQLVADTLRDATASTGLSLVGVGVLLWGTSKVFRAMDAAFAEIYDTERKLSLLGQFRDALVVVGTLAVTVTGAVVLGSFVQVPATVPFAWLLNGLIPVLGLAIAFFPIYYVFPNLDVSIREVVPGVLVAAIGWVGLKWLFNLYVTYSAKPDLYGLIGTIVLLVSWLYLGGLVLLVGAAVNATLAGRVRDENERRSKRRFGRQITDVGSFEAHLDELVDRADHADIPEDETRRILRSRAESVRSSGGRSSATPEDEAGSDRD